VNRVLLLDGAAAERRRRRLAGGTIMAAETPNFSSALDERVQLEDRTSTRFP